MLIVAGLHVPVIPFPEVPGKAGAGLPLHNEPGAANAGTIGALTVMFIVNKVAHGPGPGVKVYVLVPAAAVLIAAGLHVPVIPFEEVRGSVGGVLF